MKFAVLGGEREERRTIEDSRVRRRRVVLEVILLPLPPSLLPTRTFRPERPDPSLGRPLAVLQDQPLLLLVKPEKDRDAVVEEHGLGELWRGPSGRDRREGMGRRRGRVDRVQKAVRV